MISDNLNVVMVEDIYSQITPLQVFSMSWSSPINMYQIKQKILCWKVIATQIITIVSHVCIAHGVELRHMRAVLVKTQVNLSY